MSLTKFTKNINYHQGQPDKPQKTASQLKELFDQAGNDIKQFINETLTAEIDTKFSQIAGEVYPVGSIYMSVSAISPATLFGGTWEQLKDTFLLGAGDTYTAGDTGGEAEHTLTTEEMPSHTHGFAVHYATSTTGSSYPRYNVGSANPYGGTAGVIQTNSKGGGEAHNNMPPYLTVYMWKRTA